MKAERTIWTRLPAVAAALLWLSCGSVYAAAPQLGLAPGRNAPAAARAQRQMPRYDNNNVFAQILRHQRPAAFVYEDAYSFVFMDHRPRTRGHMLVIPKSPCRNLLDAKPKVLQHLILTVQKIARASLSAFHADGVTIRQNNEVASDQSVFHLHFHVMPRYKGAPMPENRKRPPPPSARQLEKQAAAMRRVLKTMR